MDPEFFPHSEGSDMATQMILWRGNIVKNSEKRVLFILHAFSMTSMILHGFVQRREHHQLGLQTACTRLFEVEISLDHQVIKAKKELIRPGTLEKLGCDMLGIWGFPKIWVPH